MKLFLPVYEKFSGEFIKIALPLSVRTNWNKLFCERLSFSSPHLDFHWKIFALINFFFWRSLSKLPSTWPYELFEKQFSPAKSSSQSFSEFSRNLQNFNEVSPVGLSKLNYTSPGEKFEEKFCFLKKMLFCQSRTLKEKFSPFFSSFSRRSSRNCILCV